LSDAIAEKNSICSKTEDMQGIAGFLAAVENTHKNQPGIVLIQ
jgi:hypothetical protein